MTRKHAALAALFGLSILLWGVLADSAVELISMMLGELSEHAERTMLLLSAIVWLPLAIATVWLGTNPAVRPGYGDRRDL
jgi:hypothetical protein